LGFRNLKPGPSPLQALIRAGLGLGLDGLGLAGSGLEAQPSTSLGVFEWWMKMGGILVAILVNWYLSGPPQRVRFWAEYG